MVSVMKNALLVFTISILVVSFTTTMVLGIGRPDNCDDTAYQNHPGYNENQALWDSYMADSDGVCQTRYGTGVPSDTCVHTVQVSVQGQPYYLCWYDVADAGDEQTQAWSFQGIIEAIQAFFSQLFSGIASVFNINQTVITKTITIGPYPDMWACDFYQIPFPGVNKKHVSCPYETPGAAVNDAANEFCRTVMSSPWAEAAVCDQNGVIVCTHPCETTPPHIIPQRCAFDNDRARGNQAPPLNWCPPKEPAEVASGEGRPDNCHDTAYQAHPGYNENQALWDSYMADSDGVCQTYYGEGIPSGPCAHTVQVSVGGNPYYLCWYNNP